MLRKAIFGLGEVQPLMRKQEISSPKQHSSHAALPMQGKWSIEDCKRLLRLHAEKGKKWAEIGAALGRHPENTRYKFMELALGEAAVKGT